MLITLVILVVPMKSRTFSSFSYSANEQVCRSWEGAQPDREPSWPMEIFYTIGVMVSLLMGVGQGAGSSLFHVFKFSLVQELELIREFSLFLRISWNLQNLWFPGSAITAWGLAANLSLNGEKILLYIVRFASSLLSLFSVLVVVPLLHY